MTGDASTEAADDGSTNAPTIRFVAGTPSDEEIAAVVAVLTARAAAAAGADREAPEQAAYWGRPAHVRHGRARSWAESTLPR